MYLWTGDISRDTFRKSVRRDTLIVINHGVIRAVDSTLETLI
jgi:hypothetical protein